MGNLPFLRKTSNFDFENNQHPLLLNTVIHEILKNSSISDLKNSRLVCKDWNLGALRLLKKIEGKSTILFRTISHLESFVKVYEPCPQNIFNRNLDCGQMVVPKMDEPEILLHTILPITSCIRGLKVNINIQQERTFVAHEVFQQLAQNLETFDVRFIKNDNISLTPDSVYPPTQLPSLPALTSVKIRMDAFILFVKYGNIIVHPEYVHSRWNSSTIFESEHKMLVELMEELVAKSPLLSEVHLILSNSVIRSGVYGIRHKPISVLTNLKRNELERITHLRFGINEEDDVLDLLKLANSGLNKLKYIYIDFVHIGPGLNHHFTENFLEMLECQKETLECFKLKNSTEDSGRDTKIKLPRLLPKLKILKLAENFIYEINVLDLNARFPNLREIDLTGHGHLIPCVNVKKLHLNIKSFREFHNAEKRLSECFPNVTEVKYHLDAREGIHEPGRLALWTMTSLEHLVLKVPLYSSRKMFLAILKPFEFISGGMTEQERNGAQDPVNLLARLKRCPNITWLTGLKSLKIRQRRRYECPEVHGVDNSGRAVGARSAIEQIGYTILSNMPHLKHFSSDLHCFSKNSIAQLKTKIPEFEPGRSIDDKSLFR